MTNTHFIQKQNIELVFRSQNEAEEHWDALMDLHKQEGHRVIAELFDRIVPGQNWIRIDRLEIDLGVINGRSFRQEYLDLLRSALEKALMTVVHKEEHSLRADAVSVWESNIIYYLQHGFFLWETAIPSSSLTPDGQLPMRAMLEEKILERVPASAAFVRTLQLALLHDKNAMQRWIRQFTSSFHTRIKEALLKRSEGSLQSIITYSCAMIESVIVYRQAAGSWYEKAQAAIWKILFSESELFAAKYLNEWIAERLADGEIREEVIMILEKAREAEKKELLIFLTTHPVLLIPDAYRETILIDEWRQTLTAVINKAGLVKNKKATGEKTQPAINDRAKDANKPGEERKIYDNKKINDPAGMKQPNKKETSEETETGTETGKNDLLPPGTGEEIYIENAGMVLLSPFIEHFLMSLGVDTNHIQEDDQQASLGIQLLQLLVANTWDAEEPHLALNKILCGRTPDWAGYRISEIPKDATAECTELLQQMLTYWGALRNTSAEGLQETFLQRPGKLFFKDEIWRLKVEYKTQDILLEQLPWTFSIIKLKWMPYPIHIEW